MRSDALTRFDDWFDSRTGYKAAVAALREQNVPGGPRWTYATGACTLGLFVVVAVTGVLLMTAYSPAADHGWSSVRHIESTPGGSFLRGLHYYGSHALLILFAVHLARVILTASFRAPRELAWISGVLLLPLLATAAVTGNPLPASQKSVGQIDVESHIVGAMPIAGPPARRLLLGGDEVGHLTMTRLYTLHVWALPFLAGLVLLFHLQQLLRFGNAGRTGATTYLPDPTTDAATATLPEPSVSYWPNQTARNAAAFGLVFAAVAFLAARYGVPLDAPADRSLGGTPRPEWYFRALFELRNSFGGSAEFVATGLLPGLFLLFLTLLPWIDRLFPRRAAVAFRYAVVILSAAGWAGLTAVSFARDREDADFLAEQKKAAVHAERAALLADLDGVPPDGPARLLQRDPFVQGPILFERHCATCHPHVDENGNGIAAKTPAAPNLYGFATAGWIAGMLDPERIAGPDYFGHTAFAKDEADEMISFVRDTLYDVEDVEERKGQVLKAAAALSAEAELPAEAFGSAPAPWPVVEEGRTLIAGELGCTDCHKFRDAGDPGSSPDLTGYGSRNWLAEFVANPAHERFYGDRNDGMPAFAPEPDGSPRNILTREQLLLVVDWLRGDWKRPPAAAAVSR